MTSLKETPLAAVILAAGMGKRMKSDLPKVLHTVGGKPMLWHVIQQAKAIGADPVVSVIGHKREMVIPVVKGTGTLYAIQEEQLGTGHAVRCTYDYFKDFQGDIIVLSGDVPLLTRETLEMMVAHHRGKGAIATMLTACAPDPTGYGRVLRGNDGRVLGVKEHKDCSPDELRIVEINSGIYIFKAQPLFETLKQVRNNNAQGEYYLPDVFLLYIEAGEHVEAVAGRFEEIHGVNNVDDLQRVERIFTQTME